MSDNKKISREEIAELLPHALFTAVNAYESFLQQAPDEKNAKAFKAKQEACKVGLAHIELILEFIEHLGLAEEGNEDFRQLVENAQTELDQKKIHTEEG